MNIEPVYVTFPNAVLLREKNFHSVKCLSYSLDGHELKYYCLNLDGDKQWISRPEHWQVIEWFKVKHGLQLFLDYTYYDGFYYGMTWCKNNGEHGVIWKDNNGKSLDGSDSPFEATELAITYCLKNLI
jgi:hypothetical protein